MKFKMAVAALATTALAVTGFSSASADEPVPGSSPENPIVVASPEDVPAGAVETGSILGDDCSTTTTWTLTVPATEDTSHQEFRFKRDVPAVVEESHQEWGQEERTRTFNPGSEEVSHQVYAYEKTVKDFRTENKYKYRKHVSGLIYKVRNGHISTQDILGNFGPELYDPSNGWSGSNSHDGAWGQDALTDGSGPHSDNSTVFTYNGTPAVKHSTSYVYNRAEIVDTRQVPNGSHTEQSGEVLEPLGAPWVLLDGYPKTIVDSEAVPASYGEWTPWAVTASNLLSAPVLPANTDVHEYQATSPVTVVDVEAVPGFTEFYVLGGDPSLNEADASWILAEQAPEGWTQFDERSVTDTEGTPEVVTYYAFNDGVECETPEEPEEPETPDEPKEPKTPSTPDVPTTVEAGL